MFPGEMLGYQVKELLQNVIDKYESNKERISKKTIAIEDILHVIELTKQDAVSRMKIYNNLQNILQEKRLLQDEQSILRQFYKMAKEYQNKLNIESTVGQKINRNYFIKELHEYTDDFVRLAKEKNERLVD